MNNKNLLYGLVLVVVIVGGFLLLKNKPVEAPVDQVDNSGTTSAPHETTNPGAVSETPTPPTPGANTYTLAQVSTHNKPSDCWTTINGGVYNVTSWISQHPGGSAAIISLCGIDGSAAFNGQHGGQARPASELAGFKIGLLK